MSLSVGVVEPLIILVGPYEQLMLPGILAHGAPIAAYLGLAAYLLQKADQPSPTNTDG
jgi:hypothetical protein